MNGHWTWVSEVTQMKGGGREVKTKQLGTENLSKKFQKVCESDTVLQSSSWVFHVKSVTQIDG